MGLRVEQDCPQCGAPLEMEETDRLLHCGYCNVRSFLTNTGPLRFILPRRQPDPYTVYAPYYRFKGTVYSCLDNRIEHRLADISARGVGLPFLPASLGFRPQAMKMRFVTPEVPGTFLKISAKPATILKRAAKNLRIRDEKILHQAFVGDVLNIIYQPLSVKNGQILDAIVDRSLVHIPENTTPFAETEIETHTWRPAFLPALCPQCGWSLEGEKDSVVLACSNCNSAWQAADNGFTALEVAVTLSSTKNATFLPFWNFGIKADNIKLDSYADFIRVTNQPLVPRPEFEEIKLQFVIPAFKVRPRDFLRLGSRMTVSSWRRPPQAQEFPKNNLYPVTLAPEDAARSLKTVLAESAVAGTGVFPHLPEINLDVTAYQLHYLPFRKTSHELQQPELGITINRRVLEYGRSL